MCKKWCDVHNMITEAENCPHLSEIVVKHQTAYVMCKKMVRCAQYAENCPHLSENVFMIMYAPQVVSIISCQKYRTGYKLPEYFV